MSSMQFKYAEFFLFNYLPPLLTELTTTFLSCPTTYFLMGPNHGEMESYDDAYALKTHQEFGG
jgi:hypothetical protein